MAICGLCEFAPVCGCPHVSFPGRQEESGACFPHHSLGSVHEEWESLVLGRTLPSVATIIWETCTSFSHSVQSRHLGFSFFLSCRCGGWRWHKVWRQSENACHSSTWHCRREKTCFLQSILKGTNFKPFQTNMVDLKKKWELWVEATRRTIWQFGLILMKTS